MSPSHAPEPLTAASPDLPSPWLPRPESPPAPSRLPSWYEADPGSVLADALTARLLEQRIVLVGGHLDHGLGNRAAAQLLLLGADPGHEPARPVQLHLSCPSADLDAALALADAVELSPAPVHALVRGTLAGPALVVLCAAAERTAHRNATLVLSVPEPTAGEGTAGELAVYAEQHERQVARLVSLVATATGRSDAEVERDLRAGRVLPAPEALEYGLLQRLA